MFEKIAEDVAWVHLFDNFHYCGSYYCVSIESKPRVGVFEQLKAAADLDTVKSLAAQFSTFRYASNKTRNRVARLVAQKTKELS